MTPAQLAAVLLLPLVSAGDRAVPAPAGRAGLIWFPWRPPAPSRRVVAADLRRASAISPSMGVAALRDFAVSLGFKFDDLAALMLFVVGFVGFLIHVFSLGYMHDDPARARSSAGCRSSCSR
jgi:NADH-quinone oxidoreductase subunit L